MHSVLVNDVLALSIMGLASLLTFTPYAPLLTLTVPPQKATYHEATHLWPMSFALCASFLCCLHGSLCLLLSISTLFATFTDSHAAPDLRVSDDRLNANKRSPSLPMSTDPSEALVLDCTMA